MTGEAFGGARVGGPWRCPTCGVVLQPTFGERVEDDGTRRPVLDPKATWCRVCWRTYGLNEQGELVEVQA